MCVWVCVCLCVCVWGCCCKSQDSRNHFRLFVQWNRIFQCYRESRENIFAMENNQSKNVLVGNKDILSFFILHTIIEIISYVLNIIFQPIVPLSICNGSRNRPAIIPISLFPNFFAMQLTQWVTHQFWSSFGQQNRTRNNEKYHDWHIYDDLILS